MMATIRCMVAGPPFVPPCTASSSRADRARRVFMRSGGNRARSSSSTLRLSLLQALSSQVAAQGQRSLQSLVSEVGKYINTPSRSHMPQSLEEALMTVPDLETIPYDLVRQAQDYEIREVKSYVVAETTMRGRSGFDFSSSGQAFNILAAYLFGKNEKRIEMSMTTPVVTQKGESRGERMDMTTPVIQQASAEGQWRMSFVLPAKYNEDAPLPTDPSVIIRRVPARKVAVATFSGFVSDGEVKRREQALQRMLLKDPMLRVKPGAQPEVAQFNPPFTPPFMRRNEISLEIEDVY